MKHVSVGLLMSAALKGSNLLSMIATQMHAQTAVDGWDSLVVVVASWPLWLLALWLSCCKQNQVVSVGTSAMCHECRC